MLWTLLVAVSSVALVSSAVTAARVTDGGVGSYVAAAISGLLLAAMNAWGWSKAAEAVDGYIRSFSEVRQERCLRALYIALMIWSPCAAILGVWITSVILRLAANS